MPVHPRDWIEIRPEGIYCVPGAFYIDPHRPVERALITHGHADHARAGHGAVLATEETLAIMACRYGEEFAAAKQPAPYDDTILHKDVGIGFAPAGHILGSAQSNCPGTTLRSCFPAIISDAMTRLAGHSSR